MTKTIRLAICLIPFCLLFQSCLLDSGNKSQHEPCESGEYEFTRYHQYDYKDSLAAVLVVDKDGDTISRDYFKYDSTGFLIQTIWVYHNLNSAGDTSCHLFEKINGGKNIREFRCEDETKTFSIAHLNNENRAERIAYYLSDSAIFNELIFTYNEKGLLIQIDIKQNDTVYTRGKNAYDENGFWVEGIEFDSGGNLLWKTVNIKETPARTRANIYDKEGTLSKWEVSFYNSREKIEKSISCKSK